MRAFVKSFLIEGGWKETNLVAIFFGGCLLVTGAHVPHLGTPHPDAAMYGAILKVLFVGFALSQMSTWSKGVVGELCRALFAAICVVVSLIWLLLCLAFSFEEPSAALLFWALLTVGGPLWMRARLYAAARES